MITLSSWREKKWFGGKKCEMVEGISRPAGFFPSVIALFTFSHFRTEEESGDLTTGYNLEGKSFTVGFAYNIQQ